MHMNGYMEHTDLALEKSNLTKFHSHLDITYMQGRTSKNIALGVFCDLEITLVVFVFTKYNKAYILLMMAYRRRILVEERMSIRRVVKAARMLEI